ncbi:MAG: hypothetical protein ACYTBZ_20130 [Planctomycetota bacterium]|jgi:hypothetical protein
MTKEQSKAVLILDNLPTAAMFILGTILIGRISWPPAIVYLAYCALSIVLFWALICCYCPLYETKHCPCGFGAIAPRFFSRKDDRDFRDVFKKNIAIMYPCWFVPPIAGIYLLWSRFDYVVLALFAAFCVIGFIVIPWISKVVGCQRCELKAQCPWMGEGKSKCEK